jgi:hypothetical protein
VKKTLLLVLPLALLACLCPLPAFLPGVTASPTGGTATEILPASTVTATLPATGATSAPLPFAVVRMVPADGDMPTQIRAGAAKAAALRLAPFVEFDASW